MQKRQLPHPRLSLTDSFIATHHLPHYQVTPLGFGDWRFQWKILSQKFRFSTFITHPEVNVALSSTDDKHGLQGRLATGLLCRWPCLVSCKICPTTATLWANDLTWDCHKEFHSIPVPVETKLCMCHWTVGYKCPWSHFITVLITIYTDYTSRTVTWSPWGFICCNKKPNTKYFSLETSTDARGYWLILMLLSKSYSQLR